jgi:hypothetical protein
MRRKNPHLGSSFESWLDAEGIREETAAAAIKAVIAHQLAAEMKKKRITKTRMVQWTGARYRVSQNSAIVGHHILNYF